MKFTTLILGTLLAAAALAGCSKPTETIIPSDMSAWDKELAPQVKKLSEEDRRLFAAYVARAKIGEAFAGKGVPLGTTVGQAIDEQRKWLVLQEQKAAEELALKEKLEKERLAAEAAIASAVTVTLLDKRELPRDWEVRRISDTQVFKIGVQNKSDKEIVGIAGTLEFVDVFDKRVGAVSFGISERLKPGQDFVWTGSRDYNQFIDEHKAVWNLEKGKYTTRFKPEQVVFADGTKLGSPR